eukprot:TRINITY_DN2977_c0_g2_i1.p1 TRINITY_DN2977_c0_g2~~TRINITY_DN2977_c0_g2_i1.p1  ORF type:complete len:886 (-),score=243.28 TRINITY_DN2977_c0_g2_i1:1119-3776(-)
MSERKEIASASVAAAVTEAAATQGGGGVPGAPKHSERALNLMLASYYDINADDDDDDDDTKRSESKNQNSVHDASPANLRGGASGGVLGAQARSVDLDSTDFDLDSYVSGVMKDRTLKALTDVDEELLSSIRSLDSDMQTLVYDNYNKFISATDTIREMKTKVENMDGEMQRLVNNMGDLNVSSAQLKESLLPNRKKIAKLTAVRGLLDNLNFLFNLPGRLKTSIELGIYNQAVRDYKVSVTYLKRHSYFNSFERIQNETAVIMKGLQNTLRKLIKDSNTPPPNQIDYAKLLLDLQEPIDALVLDVLTTRFQVFASVIEKTAQDAQYNQVAAIRPLQEIFVSRFLSFVAAFREVFIQNPEGRLISDADKQKAEVLLANFAKDCFAKYFDVVKKDLMEAANVEKYRTSQDVQRAVEFLTQQIQELQNNVAAASGLVKSSELQVMNKAIVDSTVKECISRAFLVVRSSCIDLIDRLYDLTKEEFGYSNIEYVPDDWKARMEVSSKLSNASPGAVAKLAESFARQIIDLYGNCFQNIHGLFSLATKDGPSKDEAAFLKTFTGHVDDSLKLLADVLLCGFLMDDDSHAGIAVVHHFNQKPGETNFLSTKVRDQLTRNWSSVSFSRKGMFLLVLGNLCSFLSNVGVDAIFRALFDVYKIKQKDRTSAIHKNSLKQVAQVLRRSYVEYHGQRLGNKVEASTKSQDFTEMVARPIGIRPVVRGVLEELKLIQLELAVAFPDTPSAMSSAELESKKAGSAGSVVLPRLPKRLGMGQGVNLDIERIFLQKVDVFGKIEEGQVGPLVGIMKAILKSLLESLRTQKISGMAFQQTQVDVFAFQLRYPIGMTNADRDSLDCLLDEVLSSAAERCAQKDPQMDPYDVEQLTRKTLNAS